MVILVTGGCGYLGSRLVRELPIHKRFEGETIRLFDNMFRDRYVSLFDLPTECRYEMFLGDVRNREHVKEAMRDVTVVFALSDITNAPLSFEREQLTYETNYQGALNVFEAAADGIVEKMIYTSTASVYGRTPGIVDETFECSPISPYGKYKLMAEQEMWKRSQENGFRWTGLRLGTVAGWSVGMRFDTVVNRFTVYASVGHPLTVWETSLEEMRPYVEIRDVMKAYLFASSHRGTDGDVYNVAAENLTMNQVVERVKRFFPDVRVEVSPSPSPDRSSYAISSEKLVRLGFKFEYSVEDGIEELRQHLMGISSVSRCRGQEMT